MTRPSRYPAEIRERVVRLVSEQEGKYPSPWAAITSIATKCGMTPETLRKWVRMTDVDSGQRPGPTTDERERLKVLGRGRDSIAGVSIKPGAVQKSAALTKSDHSRS